MHPKTIQKYIREGKLRAAKVGKSWRVTGHDIREQLVRMRKESVTDAFDAYGNRLFSMDLLLASVPVNCPVLRMNGN